MQLLIGKYKVLPAACRDSMGNNALHLCSRSGTHVQINIARGLGFTARVKGLNPRPQTLNPKP